MDNDNKMGRAAQAYAAAGFAVFPLNPRSKEPATANGFKDATLDPVQIAEWWQSVPGRNVGISTGEASGGLIVVDLDVHPERGVDAVLELRRWESEHEPLPATLTATTGGGGRHIFYRNALGYNVRISESSKTNQRGIDVRATGGYIVAPPSTHPNGNAYEWDGGTFAPEQIADANATVYEFLADVQTLAKGSKPPKWAVDAGIRADTKTANDGNDTSDRFTLDDEIREPGRNRTLYEYACSLRSYGHDETQILAAIRDTNAARCKPPLGDDELRKIAKSACTRPAGDRRAASSTMRISDPQDVALELFEVENLLDPVPLGIGHVDYALGGGIPSEGLTAIAALSSIGKTTLCLQAADNMAASGRPVLFVTIEQSPRELTAKSLARIMHIHGHADVSAGEVLSRSARDSWGTVENAAFMEACERYQQEIAPHLRFASVGGRPTIMAIEESAARMADEFGTAPAIFLDYLQLVAPPSGMDVRTGVDEVVTRLRQMARDMRTPVVAISSIGRGSYSRGITLESFKESGGIEFGMDLGMGLQPSGIADAVADEFNEAKARKAVENRTRDHKGKATRRCELVVLKNRSGATQAEPVQIMFNARAGYFYEPRVMA